MFDNKLLSITLHIQILQQTCNVIADFLLFFERKNFVLQTKILISTNLYLL